MSSIEPYFKVWEGLNFGVLLQNSLLYARDCHLELRNADLQAVRVSRSRAMTRTDAPGEVEVAIRADGGLHCPTEQLGACTLRVRDRQRVERLVQLRWR
jgi:hypothetical protein